MLVKLIEHDSGDYIEIHENVKGAELKYYVKEGNKTHLDIEMEFNSTDEAIKAADGFDEIKDLL